MVPENDHWHNVWRMRVFQAYQASLITISTVGILVIALVAPEWLDDQGGRTFFGTLFLFVLFASIIMTHVLPKASVTIFVGMVLGLVGSAVIMFSPSRNNLGSRLVIMVILLLVNIPALRLRLFESPNSRSTVIPLSGSPSGSPSPTPATTPNPVSI